MMWATAIGCASCCAMAKYRSRGLAGKAIAARVWCDRGTAGIVLVYLCKESDTYSCIETQMEEK